MDRSELILGIVIGALAAYVLLNLLWRIGFFTMRSALRILRHSERSGQNQQRAVADMEAMVLPRILRDFPDFDWSLLRSQVESHLQQQYSDKPQFSVSRVVLNSYRKQGPEKQILLDVSVSWKEKKTAYRRLSVTVAASPSAALSCCPDCGAQLQGQPAFCSFCGARLPQTARWQISKIRSF